MTRAHHLARAASLGPMLLGQLLLCVLMGCGGAGAAETTTARKLPPADPRAVAKYVQGSALFSDAGPSDPVRAAALLHEALAIDPYLWEAHYNLAVLHRHKGELTRAIEELQAALEIQPAAAEVRLALAEALHATEDDEAAAVHLVEHLDGHEDDHPARVAYTAILRAQGRYEAALEQARTVLVRDGKNVAALLEVGRIYRALGELDVSELVFQRALSMDQKDARPHNELGLTALARGDTQLAFQKFEAALAVAGDFAPARMNRASVLLRAGDYQGAADEYGFVLDKQPLHDGAAVGLAIALRGLGKHDLARAQYQRVLARTPGDGDALFGLGVLQADFLDQTAEATATFQRFLEVARDEASKARAQEYLQALLTRGPSSAEAAP